MWGVLGFWGKDLLQKESKCEVIDAEPKDIQQYIIDHALL